MIVEVNLSGLPKFFVHNIVTQKYFCVIKMTKLSQNNKKSLPKPESKKRKNYQNKRGDPEPKWPLTTGFTIVSIIFFPIFIVVTYIYLARWTCYNLNLPNAICYIMAFVLTPFFIPIFLLSFIFKIFTEGAERM